MAIFERFDKKKRIEREEIRLIESRDSLLYLARHSILSKYNNLSFDEYIKETFSEDKIKLAKFNNIKKDWDDMKFGIVVNIHLDGNFRGSSGDIYSNTNVYQDVIEASQNASFNDERFPPLKEKEIKKLKIEIFIINQEQSSYEYKDPIELLMLLKQDNEKVIVVRKNDKEAYYLPDTWEQIPDAGMFISSLCGKAGLPPSFWRGEKRLWPKKITESKQDLYTGKIIPPEEFTGIDIFSLDVERFSGNGKK